jgi:16S rRNA (adenine1518-N6/adenine1519-N6)-dimethyltransferase
MVEPRRLLTGADVRRLLEEHHLAPRRRAGQNFVVDPNTVRKIAHLAGIGPGDHVIEVGAGLGSLTLALVEAGADVTAVEIDRHLLPALRSVVEPAGVPVVHGDALTLDWDELIDDRPAVLVANLPYNVGTQIVLHLLETVPLMERMLVMVQREVAERLAAPAGGPAYGIPSVKVAYWAEAKVVGRVPASVFLPRPRVESALVDLRRHPEPPVRADRARLFSLVDTAFGQRRKMLRRSLAGVLSPEDITAAGVSPEARPETLSLLQWAALTRMTE